MNEWQAFARLVEAIAPWTNRLLFVGGWAHRLHRLHPLASPPAYLPIRTRDADLAFSRDASLKGNIHAALVAAGFEEDVSGDEQPPITEYRLGSEGEGFFVEFLTPLHGSSVTRAGKRDVTIAKAGVTAQKLRYLEILLIAPWTLEVGPPAGIPTSRQVSLVVPNAVSYIVQKLLIHKDRKPHQRPNDVLYIHDTLELFGASLEDLRAIWLESVRPQMPSRTARRAERLAVDMFRDVTDVIREAALIPQDRQLTPGRLRKLCELALREIFVR